MGQRLVIQIEDEHGPLANAYYHWNAYTSCAANQTDEVLGYLEDAPKNMTPKQKAAFALYMTGARFNPVEEAALKEEGLEQDFKFVFDGFAADRNNGLLCVTEDGMEQNTAWEEGRTTIYLDTHEVYFDVICEMTAKDYTAEYGADDDFVPVEDLPVLETSKDLEFTVDEWNKFVPRVTELVKNQHYIAASPDRKSVYVFIE